MNRIDHIQNLSIMLDAMPSEGFDEFKDSIEFAISSILNEPKYRKKAKRWKRKFLSLKANSRKIDQI